MLRLTRSARALAVAITGIVLVACGDASQSNEAAPPQAPTTRTAQAGATQPFAPVVAVSERTVGENRFALGIIEQPKNQPLPDAQVHFRFFTVQGNQATLRLEADARFVAPARDAGIAAVIQHRHADGSMHPHTNAEADVGVYVANVQFDRPGDWGVEATFRTADGREGRVTAPFKVLEQSTTPRVGDPAPRTRNLTVRDVKDLSQLDSSAEPSPLLHQETVADAIAAGRPALVAFITPGYCTTRFCGPAFEIVKKLVPKYGEKAALIHIEVWKDPLNKVPADAVVEWRLQSEPYIFVIDRNGTITAKFEGPVSLAELDEALHKVTS